jgi:3-dehydroquinate synthase
METKIISIDLGSRSYDISVGAGMINRCADFLPMESKGHKFFIISDMSVMSTAQAVAQSLRADGADYVDIFPLPAGERSKSLAQVQDILDWLLGRGIDRHSCIVAVGGGVCGDVAGFCASVMLRGVTFVQIPTTLLAQVDSSVGGKNGLNVPQGKNMIGTFYQPAAVVADMDVLRTLPRREFLAGYAEIVKIALIRDSAFFAWLEENSAGIWSGDQTILRHAIHTAISAKARIVEADEREESGIRALLNFGHTFGHALETACHYDGRLLHGEAVSIGMVLAFELSSRMGLCARTDVERVEEHLSAAGLPVRMAMVDPVIALSVQEIFEIMRRDKKSENGKVNLILAQAIGAAHLSDQVDEELILQVLRDSMGPLRGIREEWKSLSSSH